MTYCRSTVKLHTYTCSWTWPPVSRPDDRDAVQNSFTKRIISDLICLWIQRCFPIRERRFSLQTKPYLVWDPFSLTGHGKCDWILESTGRIATSIHTSRSRVQKTRKSLTPPLTVCSLISIVTCYMYYSSLFKLEDAIKISYVEKGRRPPVRH